MILNILISTIDDGIEKVNRVLLPFREDVKYIVSHQYRDEKHLSIPKDLMREDVFVSQIPGSGLTKSRNNAIKKATGDICIIADDDVKYTNEYFDSIMNVYTSDKSIDVACFKIKTEEGRPEYKNYPDSKFKIDSITSYSPSSIEITFRLDKVRTKDLKFDHRFGLGSPLEGGGENLFIHDCIQEGLNVYFIPLYIVDHPFESTIKSFSKYHTRRNKVSGALDYRLHGKIAFVRSFYLTLKLLPDLINNRKNPLRFLLERMSGSWYILNNKWAKKV
jgi:glycosyltransferase involved in cell wall biosynthesis